MLLVILGAKSNCAIRVVNRETAKRALIKGIEGMIEDLAFAFIPNQVILASLDQFGNVLIHKIQESTVEIVCALILNIKGVDMNSLFFIHFANSCRSLVVNCQIFCIQ